MTTGRKSSCRDLPQMDPTRTKNRAVNTFPNLNPKHYLPSACFPHHNKIHTHIHVSIYMVLLHPKKVLSKSVSSQRSYWRIKESLSSEAVKMNLHIKTPEVCVAFFFTVYRLPLHLNFPSNTWMMRQLTQRHTDFLNGITWTSKKLALPLYDNQKNTWIQWNSNTLLEVFFFS